VRYDLRRRRLGSHPERARQVALVGDSFTFGEGVKEENTLGFVLSEKFPTINFLNFASSGAGINQVRNEVDRVLADYRRPTDIVYFYNINDILMTAPTAQRFSYLMDFESVRWADVRRQEDDEGWLARHSTLYKLLDRAFFMRRMSALTTQNYLDMYFSSENASARSETMKKIEEMAQRSREQGVGFWVVLYPLLHKDFWGHYPFEPIHRLMMKVSTRAGAGAVDATAAFENDRRMTDFIVDPSDYHPNGLGHRRVAEYLAKTPGFLQSPVRESAPVQTSRVPVPAWGLDESSPGVFPESAAGGNGAYLAGGSMLSVDVEPTPPGAYRVRLVAYANGCRDGDGETWPIVALYRDDRRLDTVRIDASEPGSFETKSFTISAPATLRFVFLNDFCTDKCDRNVFVKSFDVTRAE
jgi:hypothetical protein